MIAKTPTPPYYVVIFTSLRTDGDNGYANMSKHLNTTVKDQPGFLGAEDARNELGLSITYWESLEAIKAWKDDEVHKVAQDKGKSKWYSNYKVRIGKVERDYEFSA